MLGIVARCPLNFKLANWHTLRWSIWIWICHIYKYQSFSPRWVVDFCVWLWHTCVRSKKRTVLLWSLIQLGLLFGVNIWIIQITGIQKWVEQNMQRHRIQPPAPHVERNRVSSTCSMKQKRQSSLSFVAPLFFGFGWIIYNNVTTISPSQSHFISGDLCSQTGCCPHVFPSFQQGEAPQLWVGF